MHNNTLKEYKKAIRNKYEIEKKGEYFDYLFSPSRGKLRDFCWLVFENNPIQDDLNVFRNLFSMDFDHTKKKKFKEQKDKFRPIETFFKGETDPVNIDAINMAAILVDLELRPFKKFHEHCRTEKPKEIKRMDKAKAVIGINRLAGNEKQESAKYRKEKRLLVSFINIFSNKKTQDFWKRKLHQSMEIDFG